MKRWWYLVVGLLLIFLVPFLLFEEFFTTLFTQEGIEQWIQEFQRFGWLGGILLLAADIVLPLPGTLIMSTMGYMYGPIQGGIASVVGLMLSGTIAYLLCRYAGVSMARRLIGEEGYHKGEQLFKNTGGWIVALSRWLPLLSEVVACMAGLSKMPPRIYFLALFCGAVPFAFLFAFIGHYGHVSAWVTVMLNIFGPAFLWLISGRLIYRSAVRQP